MIEKKYLIEMFKSSILPSLLIEINETFFIIKSASKTYLEHTNLSEQDLIGKHFFEIFPNTEAESVTANSDLLFQSLNKVLNTKLPDEIVNHAQNFINTSSNEKGIKYYDVNNTPILDENNNVYYIVHTLNDVSSNRYLSLMEKLEKDILEMNALGSFNLNQVITKYLLGIESIHAGMICSMQEIIDNKLYNLASPGLPLGFLKHINGLAIGNNVGSCGTAAYLKENVFVSDIQNDIRWEKFKEIVKEFEIKACWSHPIINMEGHVIATFACYNNYIKLPNENEINTIKRAGNILKIILENHNQSRILQKSEEQFRLLINNMQVGVMLQNEKAEILINNPKAQELLGVTSDQLLGKTSFDKSWNVIHEDGSPFPGNTHPVPMAIAMRMPIRDVIMGVFRPEIGDRIWLSVNAIPEIENDILKNVICTFIDITKSIETEEKIKKSESILKNIVDNAPIGIWYMNSSGKMEFVNKLFCDAVSLTEEQFKSVAHYSEIYPPDLAKACIASDLEALYNEGPQFSYESIPFKDGKIHDLELIKFQVLDENTNKPGLIGLMRDITIEKQAKLALQASEEKYKTLIELSPEPIAVNVSGKIIYVNPAAIKMFGANTAEEIINKHTLDFVHPDFKAYITQRMENIYNGGNDKDMDYSKLLKLDGTIIDVEAQGINIVYNGENAIQMSMRDITNRKTAEREILLSNERYELVSKATSDSIWDWNIITDQVIRLGEGFQALFGYNTEESNIDNQFWQKIVHPDDLNWVSDSIFKALENPNEKYWEAEFRIKKACGTYTFVKDKGYVIRDEKGVATRMIGATQDIDLIKKSQLALVENIKSLEDYKFALNESAIIAMTDEKGVILEVNDNFCDISEYTAEELIGNTHSIVNSNYHNDDFFKIMWQTVSSGNVWRGDIKNKKKSGGFYWARATIIPFLDKDKKPFQYLAVRFDITEIKNTKEALVDSIERYNLVAKATNDSIWDWDLITGETNRTGEGFKILFGYDSDFAKKNWKELVHSEDIESVNNSLDSVFNNHNISYWEHEFRLLKANGKYAFVNNKGYILRDSNGIATRMISATQDITERVMYLNAIEAQNKKLRQIAWDQSHIVRAPLSRMMGIVSLLKEIDISTDEFKEWVKHFEVSSEELDNVIREITHKSEEINWDANFRN